jgi:hypothetical protein
LEDIHFCDDIEIYFISDNQDYRLFFDCFQYTLRSFIADFNDAVNNKLSLHPSIKQDLGYLWSEECFGVSSGSKLTLERDEDDNWVGERYILWSSSDGLDQKLTTWLYNNENGKIILEITPSYKWHFQDPEPGENYITYQQFIKNYQPLLFRTIDREVAKKWIIEAQEILSRVEARDL